MPNNYLTLEDDLRVVINAWLKGLEDKGYQLIDGQEVEDLIKAVPDRLRKKYYIIA